MQSFKKKKTVDGRLNPHNYIPKLDLNNSYLHYNKPAKKSKYRSVSPRNALIKNSFDEAALLNELNMMYKAVAPELLADQEEIA
jgi:hypothetical protein